jgi:hypothetical protein
MQKRGNTFFDSSIMTMGFFFLLVHNKRMSISRNMTSKKIHVLLPVFMDKSFWNRMKIHHREIFGRSCFPPSAVVDPSLLILSLSSHRHPHMGLLLTVVLFLHTKQKLHSKSLRTTIIRRKKWLVKLKRWKYICVVDTAATSAGTSRALMFASCLQKENRTSVCTLKLLVYAMLDTRLT